MAGLIHRLANARVQRRCRGWYNARARRRSAGSHSSKRFTRIKNAKLSLASSTSWRALLFTATTGGHESSDSQRPWFRSRRRCGRSTPESCRIAAMQHSAHLGRVEDGRGSLGPIGQRSFSHPRSSNQTCRFPAFGFPIGFTTRPTMVGRLRLVSCDDTSVATSLRLAV